MANATNHAPAKGMPDFEKAHAELEDRIIKAQRFAQLVAYLATEDMLQVSEDRNGRFFRVSEHVGTIIAYMANEAEDACDELLTAWLATHNAAASAGFAQPSDRREGL